MNTNIITTTIWLQLTTKERAMMREVLHIPRTGGTIVEDGVVKSDGCTDRDLSVITMKALQDALDSDSTDFFSMWAELVNTVRSRIEQQDKDEAALLQAQKIAEDEKSSIYTAGVMVNNILRLPIHTQLLIYTELGAKLTTHDDKKETIGGGSEEATAGKGGRKTTRVHKDEVLPVSSE